MLEISKLLIECFHGNLTPLKWLAISQQEDLFNQICLSFNFSGEIYAAIPSTNLTTSAESERQSLSQGHSHSFPESDVVSPTDEMFGHPLATLAVANEHLDAIGETPLTCSNKSCEANGIEGRS